MDNTHGIDSDSWHIISTPESHTYTRAERCQYAVFLFFGGWGWLVVGVVVVVVVMVFIVVAFHNIYLA